jgi:hypothetical protein
MSNSMSPLLGVFNIAMAAVPLTAVVAWMTTFAL